MTQRTNRYKKVFVSEAGWFSLVYPADWEAEGNDYLAIYHPEGVGALHISAYEAPELVDPKTELVEHLSQENPSAQVESIKTSIEREKKVASFESVHEQSFQKVWFVASDFYLVIATYHSDVEDREKEIGEIEEIVHSIEFRPKLSRN
jgi:hypothetical protein